MQKNRLEAFSDGVIAIIITIMVLEFETPKGSDLAALRPLVSVFLSYLLSFVYVGTYWNNHHHLLQVSRYVNGLVLWLNLHLLFWLSLIPFVTRWMEDSDFAPWPVAIYGVVLLMSGVAYFLLSRALVALHGNESALAAALGSDRKGLVSVVLYAIAIPTAFVAPYVACAIYVGVALIWFLPDRRIERTLNRRDA